MEKSTAPSNSFDETGPEAGGADAVEKTTWVVGKGTDDRADRESSKPGEVGSDADRDPPPRRGTGADDAP
ncbi:MAG: hypothetical protein JO180_06160 [Gemmatirosa sp.]|nr:hypothetical protein [Gemmatirosa sp.]